jgi:hypothetical protein
MNLLLHSLVLKNYYQNICGEYKTFIIVWLEF